MEHEHEYIEISFDNFLSLFPEVELPVSLTSESQRLIAEVQQPLNDKWVVRFLLGDGEWIDDYTEYMPCFRIPKTLTFHAVVYWEATLLGNAYHLVTFDRAGKVIDKCVLAGTKYEENELIQTVCTIRPDWSISQIQGRVDAHKGNALPLNRDDQAILRLTTEGEIIEL